LRFLEILSTDIDPGQIKGEGNNPFLWEKGPRLSFMEEANAFASEMGS